MYDTVLIPSDGSDHARRAAEHGLNLARAFDAEVHVVNVVDVQSAAGVFSAGGVDEEFVERLETDARETVERIASLADESVPVHTAVVRGQPADGILDYEDENDADLIVMGTHGRTGLGRFVTGSVTERVVRLSDVLVLTVRATDRSVVEDGYDRVLIPTDGSDCAEAAIDHGVAIASAFGATVYALNVVDVGAVATASDVTPPSEMVARLEADGETATAAVAERSRDADLEAVTEVREGVPSRTLLDYADENDVDLVAMGTHGRTGFDRYFLGSVTEKVVRHAEMPVLSVHEPDGDD